MYTLEDLTLLILSELREIAEKLKVKNYKSLPKPELIYKILDQQAIMPENDATQRAFEFQLTPEDPGTRSMRGRSNQDSYALKDDGFSNEEEEEGRGERNDRS